MQDKKLIASVVIPTWNAASFVDRVLEKLILQEGVAFEILVIDNGVVNQETKIVTEKYQSKFPHLKYFSYAKQLGYAGAVNAGVENASSDLVAVINNDNLPDARWLIELVNAFHAHKTQNKSVIVSSLVHRPDFAEPMKAKTNFCSRIVYPEFTPSDTRVFHPDGSAFLFDKSVFGLPYDEDYFIYHEDVYLGWRAWLMGHEVRIVPESKAETFDGGSTRRIAYRTAYYTERNRWINYLIFYSWSTFFRLYPIWLFDSSIKFVLGRNKKAKLHGESWVITNLSTILKKRKAMQALRKRGDDEILPLLSGSYMSKENKLSILFNPLIKLYLKIVCLPLGN